MFYRRVNRSAHVRLLVKQVVRLETYVVNGHQSAVRPADLPAGILQALESLR
jgi:hypothetical protein